MLISNNGRVYKKLSEILSIEVINKITALTEISKFLKNMKKSKYDNNLRKIYMPSIYLFHHVYGIRFIKKFFVIELFARQRWEK